MCVWEACGRRPTRRKRANLNHTVCGQRGNKKESHFPFPLVPLTDLDAFVENILIQYLHAVIFLTLHYMCV